MLLAPCRARLYLGRARRGSSRDVRQIALESDVMGDRAGAGLHLGPAHRPAQYCSSVRAQLGEPGTVQIVHIMADEDRAARAIVRHRAQPLPGVGAQERPILTRVAAGHDPARDIQGERGHAQHHMRVEGHHRHRPGIACQSLRRGRFQRAAGLAHLAVLVLQLDQERHAACHEAEDFGQIGNALCAALERYGCQIGGVALAHRTRLAGQAAKAVVVKHHRLPVAAELQVDLDPVTRRYGRRDPGARVLGAGIRHVMQSAMRQRHAAKDLWQCAHLIWNTPSISTATPKGSEGAETAARACLPASPSASPMKSDAPLITAGCWVKSAVELTKPVSFTTRTSRSRSPPQAALTCASRAIAQTFAAAAPASTSMSAPSLPVSSVSPSLAIWPET